MSNRKIIVDTHFLIWDLIGHSRFTKSAEQILNKNKGNCYISTISFWEVGMLVGKKRIELAGTVTQFFEDVIRKRKYKVLPMTTAIGDYTRQFANVVHGDPADRILVATTIEHKAMLMTEDVQLKSLSFLDTI